VLFAAEFNKRYQSKGVTAYSLHPGVIATGLGEDLPCYACFGVLFYCCLKSVPQGAATQVYLATAPLKEEDAGKYFANSKKVPAHPNAQKEDDMKKLWEYSESVVRVQEEKKQ